MCAVVRLILTFCICVTAIIVSESQIQFYLTEKQFNTARGNTLDGRKVWSAFGERWQHHEDTYTLLFGGVVGRLEGIEISSYLKELARAKISQLISFHTACSANESNKSQEDSDVLSSLSFTMEELYISEDYKVPWEFEIGRYDFTTKQFFDQQNRNVTIGRLLHTSFDCCSDDYHPCLRHNITLSLRGLPMRNRLTGHDPILTLNQHTWSSLSSSSSSSFSSSSSSSPSLLSSSSSSSKAATTTVQMDIDTKMTTKLKICTYNIWHTNPPSWVQGYQDRWSRYTNRMKLLAYTIAEEDPDILLLQEVRLDTSFVNRPYVNGNQIEHLLQELKDAYRYTYKDREVPLFQVIYQPAMNMHSTMRNNPSAQREEEGLATLVRCHFDDDNCFEVKQADYLLLPRIFEDKQDDHQRIIQHVAIAESRADNSNAFELDVYNTHLSLSSTAREKSFDFYRQYLTTESDLIRRPQIIVGDFNAEPHENAVLSMLAPHVQHDIEVGMDGIAEPSLTSMDTNDIYFTDFATLTSTDSHTFPINDAVKRIDYIMGRNSSSLLISALRENGGVRLIGGTPHELKEYDPAVASETKKTDLDIKLKERMKLGVFENAAVTWPSDHFGLVLDIDIIKF